MTRSTYEIAEPRAGALVESLRAFGYSAETAIADLIDNSISAGASDVWVTFAWEGPRSHVTIRDNGEGMTADELRDAMRLGSTSPLEERSAHDLGRFGLGLKTASFSQCRRLTVQSRRRGLASAIRRWDLDYVQETGEWRLLLDAASESEERLAGLEEQGTIVLWENLDRLVGDEGVDDQRAQERFLDLVRRVEIHLGMVFHRFLAARGGLRIWMCGGDDQRIEAWDPFMVDHPATQQLSEEKLSYRGRPISVRPYVLPHRSKLSSAEQAAGAGPRGWTAQQGFYIYRNKRLVVPGDWLGLRWQKEEHYKLARIRVDLPNALDLDWHIDVKKSVARPPGALRDSFRRIGGATREMAAEVYRFRGRVLARNASAPHVFPWLPIVRHGKRFYRVNREHPLIASALAADETGSVERTLRLIEETVPIDTILIESAERPEQRSTPFEGAPRTEVMAIMQEIYRSLRASGKSDREAREILASMEPFHDFLALLEALPEDVSEEVAT